MNQQLIHPDPTRLESFALGRLEYGDIDEIQQHLSDCRPCCQLLDDVPDDDLLATIRRAGLTVDETDPGASSPGDVTVLASTDRTTDDVSLEETSAGSQSLDDLPAELRAHARYHLLDLIGRGGMGDVYKAEHRMMRRNVALKVIKRELTENTQAVERFHREVRAAASLSHGNIVSAYDAEQAGDVHFLAMEYVEGINLAELVHQQGAVSVSDACDYVRQAAAGLQHASEQGMVHRDIKPHNLMLTSDRTVKILDFGLASLTEGPVEQSAAATDRSHLTSVGAIMGTPDYISPEQATDARSADIRSDIYSLGATFYFLLAGRPPFEQGSVTEKLKSHTEFDAERIDMVRIDVPTEVAEIIRRMMAKDPADRFQTPAELAEALAPFVENAGSITTSAVGERLHPPVNRGALLRRVAVAAVLSIAVALAVVLYFATDTATLVINSKYENVEVVIRQDGKVIETVTGSKTVTLPSGDYEVVLKEGRGDYRLSKNKVTLTRWAANTISVIGKPPEPPPPLAVKALASMKFVSIPAGEFSMGTPKFEKGNPAERRHPVRISRPFSIGVYEVTQQEYQWVMNQNPSGFSASGNNRNQVADQDTNRFPVENVSWEEAVEFCRRLSALPESRRAGYVYRLPSEAEWEYACRANSTTAFHFDKKLNGTRANVDGKHPWMMPAKGPSLGRTATVGTYPANAFGLHDMHGNVWEWCSDWYGEHYYKKSPRDDPTGPESGKSRATRGGAWNFGARFARTAARKPRDPGDRDDSLGFRVVRVSAKDVANAPKARTPKQKSTWKLMGEIVTIPAGSAKGYSLGRVKKGSVIHLQYVSGSWKAWVADISPDKTDGRGEGRCRLAIVSFTGKANRGTVLKLVPEGTKGKPFAYRVERDFDELALRINDNDKDWKGNPGHVRYWLRVQPP